MAITDLTNTTWEIPAGWTATAGYGQFSVNNNASSTYVNPSGTATYSQFNIGYSKTGSEYANTIQVGESGIGNSYPISITFTGGTDVTNPNLISWLEANGTLQGGETDEPTDTITDLTGYTWVGNNSFELSNMAGTSYDINFQDENGGQYSWVEFVSIFFDPMYDYGIRYNDTTVYQQSGGWMDTGNKTITITGGEDATNTDLISWLQENGTLTAPAQPEQTDTKPIYKRVNGAWVKLTAFERVNGAWVKISSASEAERSNFILTDGSILVTSDGLTFNAKEN